ncbi:MAG: hypothetical protein KDB58_07650 [Solirubrobacterales bacterium]|nr:hypothetical protein [Solirubrobacterales bacterium]MCB8971432.1 hypothetical protein [Thermoleophilales bacterium]MCO5327510.1 hypothetical protein [Solirubrobacterales bacterium]
MLLVPAAASADDPVTISGKAYVFNHMDTPIPGATIRVRELPDVTATTDANGDYVLTVPDDTTVTPYIDPPAGYNEIDLQTFHTRGENLVNANFQTPADAEFLGLKLLLGVPAGPDGRPTDCAIVTTASARNVRDVDYQTFWDRTPHGVPGATSIEFPEIPGPIYFNEHVIPDATKTETSEDGGIVWTEVPAGTYRIVTRSETTRFASFLATCEPGRIVNANPPWGAYELSPGESDIPAGVAVANIGEAQVKKSTFSIDINAGEALNGKVVLKDRKGKAVGRRKMAPLEVGDQTISFDVRDGTKGRVTATVTTRDTAGNKIQVTRKTKIKKKG